MKLFVLCAVVALSCGQDTAPAFDLQATFNLADADADGSISKAELDGLFTTFDDNSDMMITPAEFVSHFMKTGLSSEGSQYLFHRVDSNSNGFISQDEVDALFLFFDVNGDAGVSYYEFASVMNGILGQLQIAAAGEASIDALLDAADADDDNELAGDELWAVLSGADTDGDKLISKDEFTKYWMAKTGDNMERAARLFSKIEPTPNTAFGSDADKKALFSTFDYDKSGAVSKQEFKNALIYLFASVMGDISDEAVQSAMSPNFDAKKSFDAADTDKNGAISEKEAMAGFSAADADGDKMLNATEFVIMYMGKGFSVVGSLYVMFTADQNADVMVSENEYKMGLHHKDRNMDMKLSFDEYKQAVDMVMYKIHRAALVDEKLGTMAQVADANSDGQLNPVEFSSIFGAADSNGDGVVNRTEFVAFWPLMTGLSEQFSGVEFDHVDTNMNGQIDDDEKTALFDAFDYEGDDNLVSMGEFGNAMLNLFATTVRAITMEIRGTLQANFNGTAAFDMADLNKDGVMQKSEYESGYKRVDTDGNGVISPTEFIAADVQTGISADGALYLFFRLDGNKDNNMTAQEVSDNFDKLDMDDNMEVSREEYMAAVKMLLHQLGEASMAGHKTAKLFKMADMDMSGNLTSTEMGSILVAADENKDGLVSEGEFKKFWMSETGEPAERTELLFGILDSDNDGQFGDDMERTALFDGFDYTDDNVVTLAEFQHSLLNLFARVSEEVEERIAASQAMDTVIGFF